MISGLVGSTLITLVFVPSLYLLCFRQKNWRQLIKPWLPGFSTALFAFVIVFLNSPQSGAKVYTFKEALQIIKTQSPETDVAAAQLLSTQNNTSAQWRKSFAPKIGLQAESKEIRKELTQTNAFGTFAYGKQKQTLGGVELTQPLFNLSEMWGEKKQLEFLEKASQHHKTSVEQNVSFELSKKLFQLLRLQLTLNSLQRLEKSLTGIHEEVLKFQRQGLKGQSDLLSVELLLSENRSNQVQLRESKNALIAAIQIHLTDFEDLRAEADLSHMTYQRQELPTTASDLTQHHPDLLAMDSLVMAKQMELKAIQWGHLPTLELKARYIYADQQLLDQKDWYETALVLKWALFEGGTRAALTQERVAQITIQEKQKTLALRQIQAGLLANHSKSITQEFKSKDAAQNLLKAQNALKEDRRNAQAGRVPLKDWLSSEMRVEEKHLQLETLKIDRLELDYEYRFLKGEPLE